MSGKHQCDLPPVDEYEAEAALSNTWFCFGCHTLWAFHYSHDETFIYAGAVSQYTWSPIMVMGMRDDL